MVAFRVLDIRRACRYNYQDIDALLSHIMHQGDHVDLLCTWVNICVASIFSGYN